VGRAKESERKLEMSKRDIGKEILNGIREVKAFKVGKKSLRIHSLREPSSRKVIRAK
jgi:putative transcriptional regulator